MESEDTNGILEYNSSSPQAQQPVGIYGWRKRCIYSFVLILMVVVVIDLALTVWILRVLDFSISGMGRLKIVPKGFEMDGEAEFLRPIYVDSVKSGEGNPLYLQSKKAVKILSTDEENRVTSSMVVGEGNIEGNCESFRIEDSKGRTKLLLADGKIVLGSPDMSHEGNIQFDGSLSTPTVRSPMGESLQISSESSKVQISGPGGVMLLSDIGDIMLEGARGIHMSSQQGTIQLSSENITLQGLPKVNTSSSQKSLLSSPLTSPSSSSPEVYQLCMCESGRLFLGLPSGDCRASTAICGSSTP